MQRVFGIFEFLVMREKTAGLYRKTESRRSRSAPRVKTPDRRKPIEAVVQLHGVKVTQVEIEHPCRRQVGWVEWPSPVAVVPARGSDPNFAKSGHVKRADALLHRRDGMTRLRCCLF